jgi:hypothetical protein
MNGGLGQVINSVLQVLGIELPPWGGVVLALVIGAIIFPYYLRGQKMVKARKTFIKSGFENFEQRRMMEEEAMNLVRSSPNFTISLAQQAFQAGRFPFARELLQTLPKNNGKIQKEAHKLQKKMQPKEDETLTFALIAVERLIEEELFDAALQRCIKIEEKWKEHPDVQSKKRFIEEKLSSES